MNKFNFNLLVLLSIFLLVGCKEKAPSSMNNDERMALLDSFSEEYKKENTFRDLCIEELIDITHDYYDADRIIVEVNNQFEYLQETGLYEIFCYYDKKLKTWQYNGYQCLESEETLDILGVWEFEVFPGFFQKGYTGYMHIQEIKDNKAKILVVAENDEDRYWGDEYWYDIYLLYEDKPISERKYKINDIITIDYEDRRYKNIVYNMEITIDGATAYNQNYYGRSKMERTSTEYKRQAIFKEYEERMQE